MVNVLLVEPIYKQAKRTKHEAKLCPVGLFRHYFYHLDRGDDVVLVKGCVVAEVEPDLIKITSLFTYWSGDVFETIRFYSEKYPKADIKVGGVFASLMPGAVKRFNSRVKVHPGIDKVVEHVPIDWISLGRTVQILHSSRGCIRDCPFCGVNIIEPEISFKNWEELRSEIQLNEVVFFDNNFLINPHKDDILRGLANHRVNNKVIRCEAQSGFDPRLLTQSDAFLLKKARFRNIRISWDFGMKQKGVVKRALSYLIKAGFPSKNVGVFMIYNWDLPFRLLEKKRKVCFDWNVQIFDCRYRPLDQLFDNYNPHSKGQTSDDYYINPHWTDEQVRGFRRNVRRQNIMIRFNFRSAKQMDEWVINKRKKGKLLNRKIRV